MTTDTPLPDTAAPLQPAQDWLAPMEAIADEDGYLDPLGPRHWAFFAETGTTLLVAFERAETIRAQADKMPAAWQIARDKGWSFLCVIAEGETFWRAHEVWRYFDRLVDDAFFDDFDQVLFYGAGAAGYAAASFLVSAPGARALLVAPRATVDPEIAGWDRRHLAARKLDFSSRYGYAPDMTDGADQVWVIHDPMSAPDAAHAALFRRPWTQVLRARWMGENLERGLMVTGVLAPLLDAAMAGRLSRQEFASLWRMRRNFPFYLKNLMAAAQNHPGREEMICANVARRLKAPRFIRRLAELSQAREAQMTPAPHASEDGGAAGQTAAPGLDS